MKDFFSNLISKFTSKSSSSETKKPGFLKKIFSKISNSTKDHLNKESSGRIGFYMFMFLIGLITITAIGVELGNARMSWTLAIPVPYYISGQFLGLLGMLIAQLSLLLNIKKNAEKSSFPSLDEQMKNGVSTKTNLEDEKASNTSEEEEN